MGGPETRRRRSALHACGCAAAGLFLLLGCTADGTAKGGAATSDAPGRTPAASSPAPGGPAPGGSGASTPAAPPSSSGFPLVPELDESKQPKTAAEARDLLGRIAITEAAFGPEVVRSTPFESDPGRWPVLDEDCVWQTAGLPADVLATSTRSFHIPAKDGRGRLQLNATVTVHHNRQESGWETARAMEEVLRCPVQKLREGEELKNLWGGSLYLGEQMNGWTEDAFSESGEYVSTKHGGPHHYRWHQAQFGPVTVAVAGKSAAGYTDEDMVAFVVQGTSRLMIQAKQELGKAAG
ncbi:hypothetical protein AB0B78_10215 [Streptomyces sp. NPDC040724]|uniref:hypothetical protein n=1 Tax=Streptomyces sp. NPDC040724 TaxID=3155612 RepID=UPI00340F661F